MKVSRAWLQKFFDAKLPDTNALAEALTFHAFEIEEHDEDMLDVKVLPDRAAYALSHRGIALELSAILSVPLAKDPLQESLPDWNTTGELSVTIDETYVNRHTGALMKGVRVGPSPEWLQKALLSIGQRSINNVVDAGNYIMNDIGQPNGLFDMNAIQPKEGVTRIAIRRAKKGERVTVLTGETHELSDSMFVFTDAVGGELLDIAGVKGGLSSGVTEKTVDLFLSAGNYDGTLIRRTAQALKLFTDASSRFQNRPSPELTMYGMRDLVALIQKVAGGEFVGMHDVYPKKPEPVSVSVSLGAINARLGSSFTEKETESVFDRLLFSYEKKGEEYHITPRFERADISIPEDIAEEVGRILGYDRVAPTVPKAGERADQAKWRGIERIKDFLVERGFTEISTPSFSKTGDIRLANPLDVERPYLRQTLAGNLREARERASYMAPRALGPAPAVGLFEVGTIFPKDGERIVLGLAYRPLTKKAPKNILELLQECERTLGFTGEEREEGVFEALLDDSLLLRLGQDYEPRRHVLGAYRSFSSYPFALRDIAVWAPEGTNEKDVRTLIEKEVGTLLARLDCFDTFSKEGRVSYAFRLVLEAEDRTLSEEELASLMEKVGGALSAKGFEVR